MQAQILNYRIIIEPEKIGRKTVYNAYCPTLGVADWGDSIEAALKSLKDGMELAIECLIEEGREVPADQLEGQMITSTQIKAPEGAVII